MKKFPIFFILLLLTCAITALGMRVEGITADDLFGAERVNKVRLALNFSRDEKKLPEPIKTPEVATNESPDKSIITPESENQEDSIIDKLFGEKEIDIDQTKAELTKASADKNYKKALKLAEELAPHDTSDLDIYSPVLFGAIVKIDEPKRALVLAQEIASTNPDNARAWNYVGWAATATGQSDVALPALEKALNLDPSLPEIHLNLGDFYTSQNEVEKAKQSYQEAIRLDGPDGAITTIAQVGLQKLK